MGSAARRASWRAATSCRVTGIDLTAEYVDTARTLSEWTGLGERLTFDHGSALAMPFGNASFDAAYMLHVGMNIPDKRGLVAEVARVLKPGALFGVYDVMRTGPAELTFPVPWAATPEISALAPPEAYEAALRASGFEIVGPAQPAGVRPRVLQHPARCAWPRRAVLRPWVSTSSWGPTPRSRLAT